MAKCRRVAVVGAGVGGLAAVKACKEQGLDVVGFDGRSVLGGVWSDSKDPWHPDSPSMYANLVMNTSKSTSCFSDFPCPRHFPPYLPYWKFKEYLDLYVERFDIAPHFKLNTNVSKVTKSKDYETSGKWTLSLKSSEGKEWQEEFDGVIVSIGFFSKAYIPDVPGLRTEFNGQILHAKDYKDSAPFVGKNVLVVGNGSSAGDISCDVSRVAKQTYLSVGKGVCLVSRVTPSGLPGDFGLFRMLTEWLSADTIKGLVHKVSQKAFDHISTGLRCVGSRAKDCPVLVNDELPATIMTGKVKVLPYVTQYRHRDIVTENGDVYSDIDVVIMATGYQRDLSVLDPSLGCDKNKLNLYKQMFPICEKHHTLALIGCQRAVGTLVQVLEVQARLAALTLAGKHKLPPDPVMQKDVDKMNQLVCKPDGTYHYSFLSAVITDAVAQELGVKPSFWKLVLSGRLDLAFKCYFGPLLAFHYRLCGPGQWDGAEEAINQAREENMASIRGIAVAKKRSGKQRRVWPVLVALSASVLAIAHFVGIDKINNTIEPYIS